MSKEPEFVDLPEDGRYKFPVQLDAIRKASVGDKAGRWAVIGDYDLVQTARDTVSRLSREHEAFEFTSRSKGDGTGANIYARFIGGM